MSLQKKILLIFCVLFVFLIVSIYTVMDLVMTKNYLDIEKGDVIKKVDQAKSAYDEEIDSLKRFAYDYGAWDETYAFVNGENADYIGEGLTDSTYTNSRISILALTDRSNQLFYSRGYDFLNSQELPVPENFYQEISDKLLLEHKDEGDVKSGVIIFAGKLLLVVSQPILKSDNSGPINGSLIIGRFMDENEIKQLSRITHLNISTDLADKNIYQQIKIVPKDNENISGYIQIYDVNDQPAFKLGVNTSREIYQQGLKNLKYLLILIFSVSAVFYLLILFFLEKFILARLKIITENINCIGSECKISKGKKIAGSDEIGKLANNINNMLERLENNNQKIKENEIRLRDISDNALEWIWETDIKGKFIYSSQNIKSILGYDIEEIIGKYFYDLASSEDKEKMKQLHTDVFSNKTPYRRITRYAKRKEGKRVCLSSSGMPIFDQQGNFAGFRGMDMDITEIIKTEEELRHRNNELENFNKIVVNRELKMIELKNKIKKLDKTV